MKGRISPELRYILSDPRKWRRFCDAFFSIKEVGPVEIDLGEGEKVVITRYPVPKKPVKRKISLLSILLGR